MKTSTGKWLLAVLMVSGVALVRADGREQRNIMISESAAVQKRLAVRDIRRFAYLRTDVMPEIKTSAKPASSDGIVIGVVGGELLRLDWFRFR